MGRHDITEVTRMSPNQMHNLVELQCSPCILCNEDRARDRVVRLTALSTLAATSELACECRSGWRRQDNIDEQTLAGSDMIARGGEQYCL